MRKRRKLPVGPNLNILKSLQCICTYMYVLTHMAVHMHSDPPGVVHLEALELLSKECETKVCLLVQRIVGSLKQPNLKSQSARVFIHIHTEYSALFEF